jgi:RNA polymerase sigma-70 factor (family 1)
LKGKDLYNEEDLLTRMAEGEQEAFTLLYRRHWEALFISTVRVILNKEDAEDIVQEVFASLWNRRTALNLTGPLGAYLQTSVKYKAINYIEKNITRRNYAQTLGKAAETSSPPSAEILLSVKEVQQLVRTAIENMPPKMQEVFRLSRQQHLSHREIAVRLDISEETVKKHIQNALQLLKMAMGTTHLTLAAIFYYLM